MVAKPWGKVNPINMGGEKVWQKETAGRQCGITFMWEIDGKAEVYSTRMMWLSEVQISWKYCLRMDRG